MKTIIKGMGQIVSITLKDDKNKFINSRNFKTTFQDHQLGHAFEVYLQIVQYVQETSQPVKLVFSPNDYSNSLRIEFKLGKLMKGDFQLQSNHYQ